LTPRRSPAATSRWCGKTRAVAPRRSAQTNGKADRFIKTLIDEWAYGRLDRSNAERLHELPAWVEHYNTERTHTALDGVTQMEALSNNLHEHHA